MAWIVLIILMAMTAVEIVETRRTRKVYQALQSEQRENHKQLINRMLPASRSKVSVLFSKEEGLWIAQCLEYDLGTQSASANDLIYEIQRLIAAHIATAKANGLDPFTVPPAPKWYHDTYEALDNTVELVPGKWASANGLEIELPAMEIRISA